MKRVLVVFPTAWDARQLESCHAAWHDRYAVELAEPSDDDCPWDFDVPGWIERTAAARRGRIVGVLSSSDYPGATAAGAIATRLGLPGTPPETLIRCSHKYYSRLAQREAAPESVPEFHLVDPERPLDSARAIRFPCFVKPVKGAFSVMARRIDSPEALEAFLTHPATREFVRDYPVIFNELLARLTSFEVSGSWFLAEGILRGAPVTVEGFAREGEIGILGIVDSVLHPGTGSFLRFDYPSSLPGAVQDRMGDVARRVMSHIGFRTGLFNIEMTWDADTDRIWIVEVNPRLCGQFADLYQKVDGTSGYEVALALAAGETPRLRRGAGPFRCASSFPLRTFEPVRVLRAPDRGAVARVEAEFPGALVWSECAPDQVLDDFDREDGRSARYAVVNLGGDDARDLAARLESVRARLGYVLVPIRGGAGGEGGRRQA